MPSTLPIDVQLGLFGGFAELVGTHAVAAHTRVTGDGTEVFVSEHLRWSRGRRSPGASERSVAVHAEDEGLPGAVQLPLWRG